MVCKKKKKNNRDFCKLDLNISAELFLGLPSQQIWRCNENAAFSVYFNGLHAFMQRVHVATTFATDLSGAWSLAGLKFLVNAVHITPLGELTPMQHSAQQDLTIISTSCYVDNMRPQSCICCFRGSIRFGVNAAKSSWIPLVSLDCYLYVLRSSEVGIFTLKITLWSFVL